MNNTTDNNAILILEDSLTQAVQLKHLLESAGYIVERAANGAKGLEIIQSGFVPDAIISDVVMPEMDGYAFTREIKKNRAWAAIPVILLTSLTDPVDVIRGLECGADNFFTKPYKADFLLSRLRYVLMNAQLRGTSSSSMGIEIFFAGEKYRINSERVQILDLLFSSFENAIEKNRELERTIQELKETQEQLQQAKLAAETANRAKSEFLGIAAHDMRNPLAAINSLSELLLLSHGPDCPPDAEKMIHMIRDSSNNMLALINDLLNASHLDAIKSGEVASHLNENDLSQLLHEVVEINRPRANSKSIKINLTAPETLIAEVDAARIREAFDNLLSNAVKYSPLESSIEVSLNQLDTGEICYQVRDAGPGLSEADQKLLFRRFQRLSPRPTGGESSTGLGLSIVKTIAEMHNGKVTCESTPGHGCTFSLCFPARSIDPQTVNQAPK